MMENQIREDKDEMDTDHWDSATKKFYRHKAELKEIYKEFGFAFYPSQKLGDSVRLISHTKHIEETLQIIKEEKAFNIRRTEDVR